MVSNISNIQLMWAGLIISFLAELIALGGLSYWAWGRRAVIAIPDWLPIRRPLIDLGLPRQRRTEEYRHWYEIETARRLTLRR